MQLLDKVRRTSKRWLYGVIALMISVGLVAGTPIKSEASIFDLIFNAIQYVQLSNINDAQEVDLGRRTDQALKQQGVRIYNRNPDIVAYVNRIGQTLASTSNRPPSGDFAYTFQIVDDDSINAFATSGGFVYINRGLMESADTEAELAGVMAHEIGHIVGKHSIHRMRELALARGIAGGLGVSRDALVGLGVELALFLPNSRAAENEADTLGFHNMGRAGYDQRGFITFMQKLGREGSPPEFLSTHPNPGNRVSNLESMYNESAVPTATAGSDTTAYRSSIRGL
ncbi:M48 family metallopeptidase [Leptolyngbya sp. PCC 6406]|uniref:M48 family metallopeptidase n=1 Tax=Leptolyngbya sp. PCC 6406 TaxID=1173264 RepID=UPI0002AD0075|nr:M48 family metallopeptidase [Leptolyngbya sp. PCC 6406]